DCSPRADRHRRLNDVLFPVARTAGNIAGQSETRGRRHRDVMCPANARLQHTPTPDGYASPPSNRFDPFGLGMTAYAAKLYVDSAARSQLNCMAGVLR